jgi:hypothetical protein
MLLAAGAGPHTTPADGDVQCGMWGCNIGVSSPGATVSPAKNPHVQAPASSPAPRRAKPAHRAAIPAIPPDASPLPKISPLQRYGGPTDHAGARIPTPVLPTSPAQTPAPATAPNALAQRAVAQIRLTPPRIQLSPPPGSQGATVGFPVWMWIPATSAHPITRTVTAGAETVTATARLTSIRWDMGDTRAEHCNGTGTPFTLDKAGQPSPDCGHTYTAATLGKSAKVTATEIWSVTWTGATQGAQTLTSSSSVQLPVREVRTLNTTGS